MNGSTELRAANSDVYARIWNSDITKRLLELESKGWKVPPAMKAHGIEATRVATIDDCGPYTLVKPGDQISPSGLYASDRDLFAFMIHPERQIDAGGGRSLFRGFFTWNSETGAKSFGVQTFLFDFVCFNHNVWGAEQVTEIRVRHIGQRVYDKLGDAFEIHVRRILDRSATDDEARIMRARQYIIAPTKDELLDKLFGMRSLAIPRKSLEAAYQIADEHSDAYGDPKSAWAMTQGLTEVSQQLHYVSDRVALDRAAGKVMEMSF